MQYYYNIICNIATILHDVRRPHGPDSRAAFARRAPVRAPPWLFLGSPEGHSQGAFSHIKSCPCQALLASREGQKEASSAAAGRFGPRWPSSSEPHHPPPSNRWLIWRLSRLIRDTVQKLRMVDEKRDREWSTKPQAHKVGKQMDLLSTRRTFGGGIFLWASHSKPTRSCFRCHCEHNRCCSTHVPQIHAQREGVRVRTHDEVHKQALKPGAGEAAAHSWTKSQPAKRAVWMSRRAGARRLRAPCETFCVSCVELFFYVSAWIDPRHRLRSELWLSCNRLL